VEGRLTSQSDPFRVPDHYRDYNWPDDSKCVYLQVRISSSGSRIAITAMHYKNTKAAEVPKLLHRAWNFMSRAPGKQTFVGSS
jgi:hypothetical protein